MGCCLSVQKDEDDYDDDEIRKKPSLHNNMLRERKENVFDKYEIIQRLGEGSMGAVSRIKVKESMIGGSAYNPKGSGGCFGWCLRKNSSDSSGPAVVSERRSVEVEYALKTIILSRISQEFIDELKNEIALMREMDHPNIVKAYEVFETPSQIYIVMELCSGGDLYKRVPFSEKASAKIVQKLCSAIKYMHDMNIVHRDLKFENIMFENRTIDAEIKVIDFGLSKKFLPEQKYMTEGVGTVYTMAPQVLQGVYTSQADLWSIGVITFMLLSSEKPFYHRRRRRVIDKIMRADYDFRNPIWTMISDEGKDFVKKLIVVDPKQRLNAKQALQHPWLTSDTNKSTTLPTSSQMEDIKKNLINYKNTSELKKVALNVIAHQSSTQEILTLRQAFAAYDESGDGVISYDEFAKALEATGLSEDVLSDIFSSIDVNKNGVVMYSEFIAASLEAHNHIEEQRIAEAFDRIDSDDSGYISRENLRKLLGRDGTKERIDRIIKEADENGDGKISFAEFSKIFRRESKKLAEEQLVHAESTLHESEANLVGLDAHIPGGIHSAHLQKKTVQKPVKYM